MGFSKYGGVKNSSKNLIYAVYNAAFFAIFAWSWLRTLRFSTSC